MEFLEKVILDNTVKSYLMVFGTILLVSLLKRFLSKTVASLLFIFVKHNWKTIEKKEFVALIMKPLAWFITIAIAVFAIDKLNFPDACYFKIYGHGTDEILDKTGTCLIIIYFIWFATSLIDFIALVLDQKAKLTKDKNDDQLIVFFRDFLKVIVTILGILLIIKAGFNQKVGTVLTGLSIVGAAMALAARESLENLIASFIIFFDKPFYTGDMLKVKNVTGTVEQIGLRSTRIRTLDKTLVTVPNKQMVDSIVDNLSMSIQRRAEIILEFVATSSVDAIERFISETATTLDEHKTQIVSHSVYFSDYGKNGIIVTMEYFTIPFSMHEYNLLKQVINLRLQRLVGELKLELVSGRNDITIVNNETDAENKLNRPVI